MRSRQQGFSIVESVLAIVVIVVLASVSWLVYKRLTSADGIYKSSANAGAVLKTPNKKNVTTKLIKLPEFGVQFTVPVTLKDLTYKVITVDYSESGATLLGSSPTAFFSTRSLDGAEDGVCSISTASATSIAPLGYLARVTGQYSSNATPPPGSVVKYPADSTANPTGDLIKQFPEFYLAYRPPTSDCFNQRNNNDQASVLSGQLSAALKTVQVIR